MVFLLFLALNLIGIAYAQTTCGPHIPPSSGRVVLTYTPYVTPQVPPKSTVYNHIVTAWTYAVDCRYVAISQVDDNPPVTGAFSGTPTTVDALTITRIGCLQETSAITRRDMVRGFPMETPIAIESASHAGEDATFLHKRATMKENVIAVASKQADDIPPDAQGISVKAYGYLVQVNTALYALNLYNTGFNMSVTCTLLEDPITQARLILASIDPNQAEAIVCYAAQFGLYFDMSNAQLLSDLLGIIYSIEVKSGFTNNSTTICNSLRLGAASFLGIDAQGIESYICGDQIPPPIATVKPSPLFNGTSTGILGTGLPGTAVTTGTGGIPITTEGPSPLFPNSTTPSEPNNTNVGTGWMSASRPIGTGLTNSPRPIGTGNSASGLNFTTVSPTHSVTGLNSSSTAAASDSWNIIFPNATSTFENANPDSGNLPPTPTGSIYYAIWTTSTTSTARMPRY